MGKQSVRVSIDERALGEVARKGMEKAMRSEGLAGSCPFCGGSVKLHIPVTECPACGRSIEVRIG